MAGHTKGPWTVAYLDDNGQSVVKSEHTEIATCWHHCVGSIEKQMHANARLIAAAPDLFEALEKMARHPTKGVGCNAENFVKEARAAIAKVVKP